MNDFVKWWNAGGSLKWVMALDAEGGTLKALEMVFNQGTEVLTAENAKLKNNIFEGAGRESAQVSRIAELEGAMRGIRKAMEPPHQKIIDALPDTYREVVELIAGVHDVASKALGAPNDT